MPYKEIMWNSQCRGLCPFENSFENLTDELEFDKRFGLGSQCNNFGIKYYIPGDAKLGGL